jgi:hypothetical protein
MRGRLVFKDPQEREGDVRVGKPLVVILQPVKVWEREALEQWQTYVYAFHCSFAFSTAQQLERMNDTELTDRGEDLFSQRAKASA